MLRQQLLLVISLLSPLILAAATERNNWTPATSKQTYALATQGMARLRAYVGKNGYASPTCTLENAVVRKEWYGCRYLWMPQPANVIQDNAFKSGEKGLYQCNAVFEEQTTANTAGRVSWRQEQA